mgnify:FL=1
MKIGVFDSGVGGLSVLDALLKASLFDELIYYGDTARVPYGNKDKETIVKFSLEAVEWFKKQKVDMLIVACNTVSATAIRQMRGAADFEIYGVIEAGILQAQKVVTNKDDKLLVIATQATINAKAYENGLAKAGFTRVNSLATGLFVPMVEEGIVQGEVVDAVFRHYFGGLKTTPKALILGCTHFPFLSEALREFFDHKVALIHSGEAMVEFLNSQCKFARKNVKSKVKFYASSDTARLEEFAKKWVLKG